jgi:hypothetical protein
MSPDGSGIPGLFIAFFVFMAIVAVLGIAISVTLSVRRFLVLRSGGLNPLTAREQLAARLNKSQLMAPAAAEKSIEQRLAELEDLHDRGVISDAELAAARAKVIATG